jgi:hypothetical protein
VNQLKVSLQQSILTLHERGWSARKIGRELGVYRGTVRKYLRAAASKPATEVTAGSATVVGSKPAIVTPGSPEEVASQNQPQVTPGSAVKGKSACEPWRTQIEDAGALGLSAKRIHQDLVATYGFTGGYQSVKRFVRRLSASSDLPFRRMECAPGEEMQVDFGAGAWVIDETGRRRRPHLFRCVLSHSRKGYTAVVWRQDTETFLRCLEDAFRQRNLRSCWTSARPQSVDWKLFGAIAGWTTCVMDSEMRRGSRVRHFLIASHTRSGLQDASVHIAFAAVIAALTWPFLAPTFGPS